MHAGEPARKPIAAIGETHPRATPPSSTDILPDIQAMLQMLSYDKQAVVWELVHLLTEGDGAEG
jgi:hypothetical protein